MTEGSSGHNIDITLNDQPEANVSVTISFDGADIPSQALDFDPTNWSQSQVATFAIPDDAIYTGSRSLSLDAQFESADATFNLGTKPIGILNILDDESEISLSSIRGIVWDDINLDGVRANYERGISDLEIYIDANDNGTFDSSETKVKTNSAGEYEFAGLAHDDYKIGIVDDFGWHYTSPNANFQHALDNKSSQEPLFLRFISNHQSKIIKAPIKDEYLSDGAGQTIVVIDTGIDRDHSFLVQTTILMVFQIKLYFPNLWQ